MKNNSNQPKAAKPKLAVKVSNDKETIELYHKLAPIMIQSESAKNKQKFLGMDRTKDLIEAYKKADPVGEVAKRSKTLFFVNNDPKIIKIAEGLICPVEIVKLVDNKKYKIF